MAVPPSTAAATEAVDEVVMVVVDEATSVRIVAPLPRVTTRTNISSSSLTRRLRRPVLSLFLASLRTETGAAGAVRCPLLLPRASGDSSLPRADLVQASRRRPLRAFATLEATLGRLPGMMTEEEVDTTVVVVVEEEEETTAEITATTGTATREVETEVTMVTDGPEEAISFCLLVVKVHVAFPCLFRRVLDFTTPPDMDCIFSSSDGRALLGVI
jgi:hypothetical protein